MQGPAGPDGGGDAGAWRQRRRRWRHVHRPGTGRL